MCVCKYAVISLKKKKKVLTQLNEGIKRAGQKHQSKTLSHCVDLWWARVSFTPFFHQVCLPSLWLSSLEFFLPRETTTLRPPPTHKHTHVKHEAHTTGDRGLINAKSHGSKEVACSSAEELFFFLSFLIPHNRC